jgi:ribosome-associated translation inhibitor RaiA
MMNIQINTDDNISGSEELNKTFGPLITKGLKRFSNRITRIEVHLSDENSHKAGQNDKRCLLEARLEGLQPVAVTGHSDTTEKAVSDAIDKLKSSLDSTLGRLNRG